MSSYAYAINAYANSVFRFALVMIAFSGGPSCVYVCAIRDGCRASLVSSSFVSSASHALSVGSNVRATIHLHRLSLSLSLSIGICGAALNDHLKSIHINGLNNFLTVSPEIEIPWVAVLLEGAQVESIHAVDVECSPKSIGLGHAVTPATNLQEGRTSLQNTC